MKFNTIKHPSNVLSNGAKASLQRTLYSIVKGVLLTTSALATIISSNIQATEFDHNYANYDQLLKQVVRVSENNLQTRVDYQQLNSKNTQLINALSPLSAVNKSQYDSWSEPQKLSFLINAYNGFTLKLIIDNWDEFKRGDAKSIRDLGSLFTSPWEKEFFVLLGKKRNLDDIEHEMVRKWFKEPRIHGALVCAAVSCPPLRNTAFVASKLDAQLDDQMQLFLADSSRNQILLDGQNAEASLSSIFKWYRQDFEKGDAGFSSLYDVLNRYSDALIKDEKQSTVLKKLINKKDLPISFKDYDWRLNDVLNF
ncbi:DUF547 domain-containing protein [Paraglaciecola aquimarina]|uniref:DUF547 domain-containing protein n=1 Tax=Paraglaciecola aquimarina TaxID=1235557 RepID=A0ABU3SX99_9ALTE|nr:DUF547 domain-containing protein [Paraglaciecola aquimarina]MDU0354626.1 DUF547 domain-containing protein [Paraglaciecola aquimarina]